MQKSTISSAPLHLPQSKHNLIPHLKVYHTKYKQLYEAQEFTLWQGLKKTENLLKLFCCLQLAWWLNRNSTSALLSLNSWTKVTSCFSEKCLAVTKASMTLGHLPLFPFTIHFDWNFGNIPPCKTTVEINWRLGWLLISWTDCSVPDS